MSGRPSGSNPFSDREKWERDPWFIRLTPLHKLGWVYILDHTSYYGLYAHSCLHYNLYTSLPMTEDVAAIYKPRLIPTPDADHFFIPRHVTFQFAGNNSLILGWARQAWEQHGLLELAQTHLPKAYLSHAPIERTRHPKGEEDKF